MSPKPIQLTKTSSLFPISLFFFFSLRQLLLGSLSPLTAPVEGRQPRVQVTIETGMEKGLAGMNREMEKEEVCRGKHQRVQGNWRDDCTQLEEGGAEAMERARS